MAGFLVRFCPRALAEGRPALMGVVNVTPDSFSDGGAHDAPAAALAHASRLLAEGADLLDLGAESTRPGFEPVPADEELRRLLPALRAIRAAHPRAVLSVDTRKAAVAAAALAAGADIVNDVSAFADPAMAPLVAGAGAGAILMNGFAEHAGERPRAAAAGTLGAWVLAGLREARGRAIAAGVDEAALCLDPGFGFGLKGLENAEVLRALPGIVAGCAPCPVLAGASRKHFVCAAFPEAAGDRDRATVLFHAACVRAGAAILRVHDVAAHRLPRGRALW